MEMRTERRRTLRLMWFDDVDELLPLLADCAQLRTLEVLGRPGNHGTLPSPCAARGSATAARREHRKRQAVLITSACARVYPLPLHLI